MKGRLLLPLLLLLGWAKGDPPEGECSQNPIIAFQGTDTVLEPVVDSTATYITWKKEEHIVAESAISNNLNGNYIIKNVSRSHDGLYTAEIEIGRKIEYKHFCLKILEYLEPPILNCSDHSDYIQVNCTPPPQIDTHNLPVSYYWEDRGKDFGRGQSIILPMDESLSEKITCIIHIYNVQTNMSITLTECLSKKPDQGRSRLGLWISLVVTVIVIAVFGFCLWKKGWRLCDIRKRKSKDKEDTGNADVSLNEMPTNNGPRGESEDSNDNRSEGHGEDVPLNETTDENSKDDRREGHGEDE
nr:uncharacterized protein LOC132767950 isoform X2 [Anolis sagrei ordinatus]XP_060619388.1 uncharacterized protein LOC132767950 isoform X2 [Anolis sagrei ordinatus]